MRRLITVVLGIASFLPLPVMLSAQTSGPNSLVVVFKDGHRQTLNLDAIERLEFPSSVPAGLIHTPGPSRARFLGKWEVGEGNGENFTIVLNDDGTALRSMDAGLDRAHGTWKYVDGEAQITWNDGWQDCIRKVGAWYRKFAYSQGKTFHDQPDNITNARNLTQNPGGVD
jgi:hypothetical protein